MAKSIIRTGRKSITFGKPLVLYRDKESGHIYLQNTSDISLSNKGEKFADKGQKGTNKVSSFKPELKENKRPYILYPSDDSVEIKVQRSTNKFKPITGSIDCTNNGFTVYDESKFKIGSFQFTIQPLLNREDRQSKERTKSLDSIGSSIDQGNNSLTR